MNQGFRNISGIVLAGGKSSRMGEDKGLMQLSEKPMVAHVIDQLRPCVEEVLLIANRPQYEQFGCRVLPDLVKAVGPMGGIYTGLKDSPTHYSFFVSCDMPFITSAAVNYLIEQAAGAQITVATMHGQLQPLFGLYNKTCIPMLEQSIKEGRCKLQQLILEAEHQLVPMDSLAAQHNLLFENINTPQEFSLALTNLTAWK